MLLILKWAYDKYPEHFEWKNYPTRANPSGERHLDLLLGVYETQKTFEWSKKDFLTFWASHLSIKDWNPILIY